MYDDPLTGLDEDRHGRLPRPSRSLSSRGAIYHLSVRTGTRSKGHSARAAAAYIQREQEYERGRALAGELVYIESGHMPRWAEAEPSTYWRAADEHERANGRLFKRVEFALPTALSEAERQDLAVGFAHHLTDGERLPYTLALHAGRGTNPHAHLLISERGNDGLERAPARWFKRYNAAAPAQGGARKSTALHPKAWLEETRAAWAEQTNQALERAGHDVRIDHRSLEAQGIDRLPQMKLGPAVVEMEARGIETRRGNAARAIVRENAALERELAEIARERAAIQAALGREAERERSAQARDTDGPTDSHVVPALPPPAAVARNPAVEERIAALEDPEERAKAWKLLETIRSEVAAQERPISRERERERARERERQRERERDRDEGLER